MILFLFKDLAYLFQLYNISVKLYVRLHTGKEILSKSLLPVIRSTVKNKALVQKCD